MTTSPNNKTNYIVPDVFDHNSSLIQNAMKALSPEQKEYYKKLGEDMYGTVDFNGNKIINNLEPPVEESILYIEESLKSGLHPSYLSKNELSI